ncbi:DNA-3-methyladenine glycosylase family protein [Amycolatopsis sp. H20-H5]|uniref:DNA-3-methyladenine glycosylase family protein n=1 Tax=Amycolatopsis sp. H20-H5 TaxID=3046309 RepID=UPI002DB9DDC9|nr:DNA-3-methyladenine glycosylase 2 family protein [Amycolatopsis sp. H20-H5]MEC3980442.1 DNA-3-methyladenine glycosylase 2 family protein [Amycolatopsis sp. H20-H5]
MTTPTLHHPRVTTHQIPVHGPFDLAASIRFLEGFTPAARPDAGEEAGTLLLAFPAERGWAHVGALIRQRSPGSVEVEVYAPESLAEAAVAQVRRILSLDVDGTGFSRIGAADKVIGNLQLSYPGLRPVLFHSPYEAACWGVIGHRLRIVQAAKVKQRLAEEYGWPVDVGGRMLASFPGPDVLAGIEVQPGLPLLKIERLRALARAAKEGLLDAESLRAMPVEDALAQLQRLPGVGPFYAQLILVRGAGHPDVFPQAEGRLHQEMTRVYGVPAAKPAELAEIAENWQPYRSWAALLLRADRENRTGEIGGGKTA